MKKYVKGLLWLIGLAVVIILVQLPKHEVEDTWHSLPLPLAGKVIVLDPGHGGPDGGAEGKDGTQEKDVTLMVAKQTRDYLEQSGALVYLTREDDTDLAGDTDGLSNRKSTDIRKRLRFIEEKNPDLFISIHLNAIPSEKWSGAQTFYYPSSRINKALATNIQDEIKRNLENTNRTPLANNSVYLLKHADVPGALAEIGFLSNVKERDQLKKADYQKQVAASIYQGIIKTQKDVLKQERGRDKHLP